MPHLIAAGLAKSQICSGKLTHLGAAHQLHAALDFRPQKFERQLHAFLTAHSERKKIVTSDADRLCSDRKKLQDVCAALDA